MSGYIPHSLQSLPEWQRIVASEVNKLIQDVRTVVAKSAAYTIADGDDVVTVDATAGAVTITLPAAQPFKGRHFIVKKVDASLNAVTVDGNGAETIDGAASASLAAQWDAVRLVSDGANWLKV